jgi:hypothetical protein
VAFTACRDSLLEMTFFCLPENLCSLSYVLVYQIFSSLVIFVSRVCCLSRAMVPLAVAVGAVLAGYA